MRILHDAGGITLVVLTWILFYMTVKITLLYVLVPWFGGDYFITSKGWTLNGIGLAAHAILCTVSSLAIMSHARAVFSDPGSLTSAPFDPPALIRAPRLCKLCNGRWKPPRAHHCRKCQTCVFRMDHHCPWINNCVGLFNQKYFILFLIYTVVACSFNLFLLLAGGLRVLLSRGIGIHIYWKSVGALTFNVAISAFFLFMSYDFLSEQYEAIVSNSTLVESYQSAHGVKVNLLSHMRQVFGVTYPSYLLPIAPTLDINFEDPVMLDESVAKHLNRKNERKRRMGNLKRLEMAAVSSGDTRDIIEAVNEVLKGTNGQVEDDIPDRKEQYRGSLTNGTVTSSNLLASAATTTSDGFFATNSNVVPEVVGDCKDVLKQSPNFNRSNRNSFECGNGFNDAINGEKLKKRLTYRTYNSKDSAKYTKTSCSIDSYSKRSSGNDVDDGNSSPCFMNVFVRPKQDIGVDIDEDDERHFVRLSSSSDTCSSELNECGQSDSDAVFLHNSEKYVSDTRRSFEQQSHHALCTCSNTTKAQNYNKCDMSITHNVEELLSLRRRGVEEDDITIRYRSSQNTLSKS